MKHQLITLGLLLAALFGCSKQQPRHIVILPDVSGSIDRGALQQAFEAIDEVVRGLRRGDKIAVIPILSDAQAEVSGRIMRFEVPLERRAYDADLSKFQHQLKDALAKMQTDAVIHPGSKTDILGSIELAEQELQAVKGIYKQRLLILSDFIQENNEINFRSDERLATFRRKNDDFQLLNCCL